MPASYIVNEGQKLEIYKKIAAIQTEEDYMDMQDELIDRFSDMPPCVCNLLDISYIKAMANHVGCDMIEYKQGALVLQLREDAPLIPAS